VASLEISSDEFEREVMDHLQHMEITLEAMCQDIAEIKASLDRTIVLCGRATAMPADMGREMERVH